MSGAIRTRVAALREANPEHLADEINTFQESHNVFATQTHPPVTPNDDWIAFVFYREPLTEVTND